MTTIAQRLGLGAFSGEVARLVIGNQKRFKNRSVWPVGSAAAGEARVVAVVEVDAGDEAALT